MRDDGLFREVKTPLLPILSAVIKNFMVIQGALVVYTSMCDESIVAPLGIETDLKWRPV